MAKVGIHLRADILFRATLPIQGLQQSYERFAFLWSHEPHQLYLTIYNRCAHLLPHWPLPCTLLRIYVESRCCHIYVPVADAFLQMVAKVAQARPTRVPMAQMDLGTLKSEAINQ